MNLQIFSNSQFGEVRVAKGSKDEPLFCLADLCKILDLQTGATKNRLNERGISLINTPTTSGKQNLIFIDEPNFYKAVFQSRKPEAEAFTEWVTSEVLPAIRKHGAYLTPDRLEQVLTDPDTLIAVAQQLKQERTLRQIAEQRAEIQSKVLQESAPKVQYCETVLQSESLIHTTIIAKELGMSAITLNRTLNRLGIIYKSGEAWVLVSKYQNKGYTGTRTHHFTDNHGQLGTQIHTYWTEKGRQFIHSLAKAHNFGFAPQLHNV